MASAQSSSVESGVQNLNIKDGSNNDIRSQLKGVVDSRYNGEVVHYRGIPYATISKRFAKPKVTKDFPGKTKDCTKFGPRCPQIPLDIRDFMQIPKTVPEDEPQAEDEFKCTNLNVTCPTSTSATNLPVFMWIYGGSQFVSYGDAQHRIGDTGPLVAQSIELGKPIILVTIHYRLNIFQFGNGETNVNLNLHDQKAALQWINTNISKFGGDSTNVTVGGESAGSICTHALLASGAEFQRAILQSGTLHTSPPQPERAGLGLVGLIEGNLQLIEFDKGNQSGDFGEKGLVTGADPEVLIQTLMDLQITRVWMWDEPYFNDWDNNKRVFGKLKGLLLGDVTDEWALFVLALQNKKWSASKIRSCFETKKSGPEAGQKLAKVYGIDGLEQDDATARLQAVHFMGDSRFSAWNPIIAKEVNASGGKAYQYLYDQLNPFPPKEQAVAQHGIDLLGLFGGYDEIVDDETRRVGRMMRTKWIDFVNGEEPWQTNEVYLFGPNGMTGEIDRDSSAAVHDLNPRRRQAQLAVIQEVGWKAVMEVCQALLASAASSQ